MQGHDQDEALALHALGWTVADEARGERLLAMTGLDPERLRAAIGERATLAAVLAFLAGHEADLVACAAALGVAPARLAAAGARLDGRREQDA